jgi:hypothetical protein
MLRILGALALAAATPAAARPVAMGVHPTPRPHHPPGGRHVRIHRGRFAGAHRGHGDGRGYDAQAYGWPTFGYGSDDDARPRPSDAGFFTDGETWMRGRQVVYEYDRGYPYEHYRRQRSRRDR